MPVVNIRELARSTSRVIGAVARTKRPALVTKGGRPVAIVSAVDAEELEDWVLANAPEFVEGIRRADAELAAGKTISLDDFLAGGPKRPPSSRSRRATRRT